MRARAIDHGWGECSCGTFHEGPAKHVELLPDGGVGYGCPDDGYGMPTEGLELDGPAWVCRECGRVWPLQFDAERCCRETTRMIR